MAEGRWAEQTPQGFQGWISAQGSRDQSLQGADWRSVPDSAAASFLEKAT